MAHLKGELSGAHNLAKASRKGVCQFFTSRRCPPRGWTGPAPALQKTLMRKFSNHVAALLGLSLAVLPILVFDMQIVKAEFDRHCHYLQALRNLWVLTRLQTS